METGAGAEAFLTTIAEIAASFAGFSGLIGIFSGSRESGPRLEFSPQFWIMIEGALGTLLFALLPLLLEQSRIDTAILWATCSLPFVLFLALWEFHALKLHWRLPPEKRPPRLALISGVTLAATIFGVLLLISNAAGWLWPGSAFPYAVVLLGSLAGTALNFVLLLVTLHADL